MTTIYILIAWYAWLILAFAFFLAVVCWALIRVARDIDLPASNGNIIIEDYEVESFS